MEPTWILVADNARARIFTIERPRGPLIEQASFNNPEARQHERDLVTDRPGREQDRGGPGRTAFEAPSARATSTERFARDLVQHLTRGRARGDYRRLYLIAAPHFLGLLRGRLDTSMRACVSAEIAKDVVHEKPESIRRHLPERMSVSLA